MGKAYLSLTNDNALAPFKKLLPKLYLYPSTDSNELEEYTSIPPNKSMNFSNDEKLTLT